MTLQNSDWIAIGALAVAVLSLMISGYTAWNDRPRLRVTSAFSDGGLDCSPSIVIRLVNVGRRPVVLDTYGGYEAPTTFAARLCPTKRGGIGSYFDPNPLVLEEQRHHELRLYKKDIAGSHADGELILFDTLWVQDSQRRIHMVPGSRRLIDRLWEKPKAS